MKKKNIIITFIAISVGFFAGYNYKVFKDNNYPAINTNKKEENAIPIPEEMEIIEKVVKFEDTDNLSVDSKFTVKNGNIYFSKDGINREQLTNSGKDRTPVFSPDEQKIVFIRKSDREAYSNFGKEKDIYADQVWIIDINDRKEKMLINDWNSDIDDPNFEISNPMIKTISHIRDSSLQFSPDEKKVYFITAAWVTSGAVHCVNIDGTDEHFVVPSNYLEVIDRGEHKGDLIIQQHRYFLGGGSYDWYWLYSIEDNTFNPIGESMGLFKDMYVR